jgi:hypothetical protein
VQKTKPPSFFFVIMGLMKWWETGKKYLPLKYYTDETISPEFWDREKGRAKETKNFPHHRNQ